MVGDGNGLCPDSTAIVIFARYLSVAATTERPKTDSGGWRWRWWVLVVMAILAVAISLLYGTIEFIAYTNQMTVLTVNDYQFTLHSYVWWIPPCAFIHIYIIIIFFNKFHFKSKLLFRHFSGLSTRICENVTLSFFSARSSVFSLCFCLFFVVVETFVWNTHSLWLYSTRAITINFMDTFVSMNSHFQIHNFVFHKLPTRLQSTICV